MLRLNAKSFHSILSRSISNQKLKNIKPRIAPCDANVKSEDRSNQEDTVTHNPGAVSVALIGGGITPAYTALLLKQAPIIKFIYVADMRDSAAGLLLDASHVDTSPKIRYFKKQNMAEAMREVNIIALMDEGDFTAGKTSSQYQFLANSRYVKEVAEKMVQICPTALVAVFAHPVTAMLPLVSEIYKYAGWWDPDRIVGSLAIDSMRIRAMAANLFDLNPAYTSIPIVGGADVCTIVPLLSQAKPINEFSKEQRDSLIQTLRASDNELARIPIPERGGGGPKLSIAAAASKFIVTLAGGYCGFRNAVASAFVRSNVLPGCRYFATELQFGPGGVQKNLGLPKVSTNELELIEIAVPLINANVDLAMNLIYESNKVRSKI